MQLELTPVKPGLVLVMAGLLFGIWLGVSFGINEDGYKDYIAEGITRHQDLHDAKSADKIWRYAQRAHFHATGIAAFSLGLVVLVAGSGMQRRMKTLSSVLIGLGGLYPLGWYNMYLNAPVIGRAAAHDHILTELFTYAGVGGLLVGLAMLLAHLYLGQFGD